MKIGIRRERQGGERRVAATPDTVDRLRKLGFDVVVEAGAGEGAAFVDAHYVARGAEIGDPWTCDVVLGVRPPDDEDVLKTRAGQVLISHFWPAQNGTLLEAFAATGATVVAMDQVPRITRAQKLDALSSQANLAGYRAVVEAAAQFGRFFNGQITAAGKVPPAKVLIIGAGVAGLAAIGAARGLGAVVRAFDTRPVVREQVQSMGAEFLEVKLAEDGSGEGGYAREMSPAFIEAEMALFLEQAKEVDVILTTALIPGKRAPLLLKREAVEAMKPGSVVVDLAAEMGGNCELTRPGEVVVHNGVRVVGYTDLPSRMAEQASQLYGTNLCHLLDDMGGAANFRVDMEDEVVRPMTVAHGGEVTWPPPKMAPKAAPAPAAPKAEVAPPPKAAPPAPPPKAHGHGPPPAKPSLARDVLLAATGVALLAVGAVAPPAFLTHLLVFVLACFVGWQVVWSVTPALHTPLMSVTNAISGIILVGGLVQLGHGGKTDAATILGALAVLFAMINVAGGFLVTQRMLKMFRREG
ncbi:MAG: Re/Si-specific NAD(P)(+) transhydrogenase subunit alpha [Myxococcota bacterium]